MEGQLGYIIKSVDKAQSHREETAARLSNLEARVKHVERALPQISENVKHNAMLETQLATEDEGRASRRAGVAMFTAIGALVVSAMSAAVKWITAQ